MAPNPSDLRNTRRFSLKLPLSVKFAEGQVQTVTAQTKDVSARGVFFYLNSDVAEGSPIEFTLTLPPEITLTESIRVHCTGKVVRVDQAGPGTQVGIAAAIDQYDFVSE
jgi:hypothetical protein